MRQLTRPIEAALLAAELAQRIGLEPGNLWEPPITRAIEDDLTQNEYKVVRERWIVQLGLSLMETNET